jgi:hypothetical protein
MLPPSAPRRPWQEIAAELSKVGNIQNALPLMNELGEASNNPAQISSQPIDEGHKKNIA